MAARVQLVSLAVTLAPQVQRDRRVGTAAAFGCPPSPCDAYQNEADCERPSDRCVWAEVRLVPEGDVECSEGFTELRCLEMSAGGPGSCVVSSAECNEGTPLFVQTERGLAFIQHSGCGPARNAPEPRTSRYPWQPWLGVFMRLRPDATVSYMKPLSRCCWNEPPGFLV